MDELSCTRLVELLKARNLTLAAAESCTGGWFAKSMVDVPGASAVFYGGVVSYVNEVKTGLLHVSPALLAKHTAVSAPCAAAMADGVRAQTGADIGISVTGFAGPDGGTPEIPVGRVFIGISHAGKETETVMLTLAGGRKDIRRAAVAHMIKELEIRLGELPYETF